jgi:hypothetical protein
MRSATTKELKVNNKNPKNIVDLSQWILISFCNKILISIPKLIADETVAKHLHKIKHELLMQS